jgi:hypothetical protein
MKKLTQAIAILLVCALLGGCAGFAQSKTVPAPGPEVGRWHAEIRISDLNLSDEDRVIMTLLAGNVAYETDLVFYDDGTFSWEMNMEQFRSGVREAAGTLVSLLLGFDLDLFIDRIVVLALESAGAGDQSDWGSYTVDGSGLIVAAGNETRYFSYAYGKLRQLNGAGDVILVFSRAE